MSKGERILVFGEMSWEMNLQVFTGGGDQTPKGKILGIMANVLSLMETYLI